MNLPDGEVTLHEVLEWAQEQAVYLTPTQCLVLWYLCMNAFRSSNNPEKGRGPGDVLSGRVALSKIQMRTGLSQSTVRRALRELQEQGYIYAHHVQGRGKSRIAVFWTETADEVRAEVRAGIRELPKGFHRPGKRNDHKIEVVRTVADVIPFPKRSD